MLGNSYKLDYNRDDSYALRYIKVRESITIVVNSGCFDSLMVHTIFKVCKLVRVWLVSTAIRKLLVIVCQHLMVLPVDLGI